MSSENAGDGVSLVGLQAMLKNIPAPSPSERTRAVRDTVGQDVESVPSGATFRLDGRTPFVPGVDGSYGPLSLWARWVMDVNPEGIVGEIPTSGPRKSPVFVVNADPARWGQPDFLLIEFSVAFAPYEALSTGSSATTEKVDVTFGSNTVTVGHGSPQLLQLLIPLDSSDLFGQQISMTFSQPVEQDWYVFLDHVAVTGFSKI